MSVRTKTAPKTANFDFFEKKKCTPPDNVPKMACAKYLSAVTTRYEMIGDFPLKYSHFEINPKLNISLLAKLLVSYSWPSANFEAINLTKMVTVSLCL